MFKKLHSFNQDSSNNIYNQELTNQEITYRKKFIKNNISNKKQSSYGQKFRKKNHLLPNIPQLQIIQSESYLFQGRLASVVQGSNIQSKKIDLIQKHGQGIMFLKNGTLIVGFWDHGILNGRALIFTPFGGRTIAQFYNGKLNGWAITSFSQKLIVLAVYYDNKIDGQKIIYEATQKMWVGSTFAKQSNTYQIMHVEQGKHSQLPSFLKYNQSNELIELFDQFIKNQNICLILKQIEFIPITQNLNYIGYCNQQHHPNGLGAIYGKNEYYLGHFRDGSLECYGRMIFQNGQIYHGQLLNGVFYGQGVYYNPSRNLSTIMYTNRDQQKILDQQEGYISINISLNYFKFFKNNQTGMMKDALLNIHQILQKYYSRYFIQKKKHFQNKNSSAASQFGISENNQEVDSSLYPFGSPKKELQKDKTNQKYPDKWLDFKDKKQSNNKKNVVSQSSDKLEEQIQNLKRVYSLDKRQAANMRKKIIQQSYPINLNNFSKNSDKQLESEINLLSLDRNLSLRQKKYQNRNPLDSLKVQQNIRREENQKFQKNNTKSSNQAPNSILKKSSLILNPSENEKKKSSLDILTFRNSNQNAELKVINDIKNQRKYSQMIQNISSFQQKIEKSQSQISHLPQKVDQLIKKGSSKRRKIFM